MKQKRVTHRAYSNEQFSYGYNTRCVLGLLVCVFVLSCSGVETARESSDTAFVQQFYQQELAHAVLHVCAVSHAGALARLHPYIRTLPRVDQENLDTGKHTQSGLVMRIKKIICSACGTVIAVGRLVVTVFYSP